MSKCEILGSIKDVSLCKQENFYCIKRNDGFMWDMAGDKEKVKSELERWLNEIDFNNEYMSTCEKYFISLL